MPVATSCVSTTLTDNTPLAREDAAAGPGNSNDHCEQNDDHWHRGARATQGFARPLVMQVELIRSGDRHNRFVVLAALMWCCVAGCASSDGQEGRAQLSLARTDSGGVRVLTLSHSLHEVANGVVAYRTLTSDLVLGEVDSGFGHLADVTVLDSGHILALDRSLKAVWVFDQSGDFVGMIGREGKGPGEFTDPIALAALGEDVVVMQPSGVRPFTVLDLQGEVVGTTAPNLFADGDWGMHYRRGTLQTLDFPFQASSEDWTRRIDRYDDSSFVYLLQQDEKVAMMLGDPFPLDSPPVFFVRFSRDGSVTDTVHISRAPPSRNYASVPGREPQFDQPIFARRPMWASGSGWIAMAHGSQHWVDVVGLGGEVSQRTRVTWPEAGEFVSESEKVDAVIWLANVRARDLGEFENRRPWNRLSRSEKRRRIESLKDYWEWPDRAPEVTATYGAGSCLWMAGFSSSDYADGTSLTWLAVNVESGRLEGVFRIPRTGSRVRHVSRTAIYT